MQLVLLVTWILLGTAEMPAHADELKPETNAAFDRYIAATEARMDDDVRLNQFLVIDRLPASRRQEAYNQIHQNQSYIEELHTQKDNLPMTIPNGLIHHWVGVMFIPKGTLSEAIGVIEDYANQPQTYSPEVRRSKLIEQNGNEAKIYIQFANKLIITVVLNVYFDVSDAQFGSTRRQATSRSTRIAEVANPGSANEYERPTDSNHGYMWRFNNYWRIEERDGGVYVQNESITLSRTFPPILSWVFTPLIKSVPSDVLLRLLTDTRKAVMKSASIPK
jgi:hypothetical protein